MRLIGLLTLLAAPLAVVAQPPAHIPRLCFLALYPGAQLPRVAGRPVYEVFLGGLRDLGYVEGQNLMIDYLSADGQLERFPTLASACLRLQADIIVAQTTPGVLAAKRATQTIPIVMLAPGDPVGTGLVESLARPGGNVTGQSNMAPGLITKRLELLKEVVPHLVRVVVLTNLADPVATPQQQELEAAARAMGVQLLLRDVRSPEEVAAALSTAATEGAEGLLTTVSAMFNTHRTHLVDNAARHRLPAVYSSKLFVDAGGLMSYGTNIASTWLRAATFVDKILQGAKPADLPVEQPTRFELIINLKTAQALGRTIPPHLLVLADEVLR
jgi:putative ABC transport system substrate-binding protein